LDDVTLVGSLIEIVGAIAVIYLLRKQSRRVMLGMAGALFLLGLTLLGIAFDVISGLIVWVPTVIAVALFATFFYIAVRRPQNSPSSSDTKP
jgi:hypothetical protein